MEFIIIFMIVFGIALAIYTVLFLIILYIPHFFSKKISIKDTLNERFEIAKRQKKIIKSIGERPKYKPQ